MNDHKVIPIYTKGKFRLMAQITKLVIVAEGRQVDSYPVEMIDEAIQTVDDMAECRRVA